MKEVLRILIAPLVWLAAFSAIYGLHGLICGHGVHDMQLGGFSLSRSLLVAAYVLAIIVQLGVLAALYSKKFGSRSSFVRFVSLITGWTGLVATLWSLSPVIATSYCS